MREIKFKVWDPMILVRILAIIGSWTAVIITHQEPICVLYVLIAAILTITALMD